MARFFIDRPIFAWVIAILIMLAGLISIFTLPVAQYPSIAPPEISITARYPDSCVRLPMIAGTRSLNLSNSVAVATYEYYRRQGFPYPLSRTDG